MRKDSTNCPECMNEALKNIPTQPPILSWLDDNSSNDEIMIMTNDPAKYDYTLVREHEQLADVTRRVYKQNNVINRLRLDLANNGNIFGWIRIPR